MTPEQDLEDRAHRVAADLWQNRGYAAAREHVQSMIESNEGKNIFWLQVRSALDNIENPKIKPKKNRTAIDQTFIDNFNEDNKGVI